MYYRSRTPLYDGSRRSVSYKHGPNTTSTAADARARRRTYARATMADARARDDARDVAALVRALVERTLANATPTNATPTHATPTHDREATRRADAGRRVATRVLASTLGEGTRARDAMDDGEAVARAREGCGGWIWTRRRRR